MRGRWWLLGLTLALLAAGPLPGQGILLDLDSSVGFRLPRPPIIFPPPRPLPPPPPPSVYAIKELSIQASLRDQRARVQVSQTFVNTGRRTLEATFVFPLPYDSAVEGLTFLVDGKEIEGRILPAQEARRIYEQYMRRRKDPALMEWLGWGMFKTSVFPIPPGEERTVTLRYTQWCRKTAGLTELLVPLSTAKYTSQPLKSLRISVNVQSSVPIRNIYSPTHSVTIDRSSDTSARVTWEQSATIPTADFRLFYDVGDQPVAAQLLSYRPKGETDGYFLLLLSPELPAGRDRPLPKTVIFVLDRSGSMSGKKIEQAREALRFVLNHLNEGDLFNVIAYDSEVEGFRPELQRFNDTTRKEALGFVEGIYAGGSTNIDGALKAALAQLQDDQRPAYVLFLTDGLPTAGEVNVARIVANTQEANKVRARLFCFGVGYDVNSRLLDKLARTNFGQSVYVRPDEDIESYVAQLYRRIGAPALTDVELVVERRGEQPEEGPLVWQVYPKRIYDLFAGDQLVVVGKYRRPGPVRVAIRGKVDGQTHGFEFPAELAERSPDDSLAFIARLWATRRIGEIVDQIDLHGKNQELIDELVELSKRYGILTPYTAFLAEEPHGPVPLAEMRRRAGLALDALQAEAGRAGFAQRAMKWELQMANQAPAFGGFGGAELLRDMEDRPQIVRTVQTIGSKTFYLQNGQWVDSSLQPHQRKSLKRIERFSPEYFQLVAQYGREVGKYLAMDGEIVLVLGGQAYLIPAVDQ